MQKAILFCSALFMMGMVIALAYKISIGTAIGAFLAFGIAGFVLGLYNLIYK